MIGRLGARRAAKGLGRTARAYNKTVAPAINRNITPLWPKTGRAMNKVGRGMSRHPVLTASGMYTAGMAYGAMPGPNRSRTNQADPYLRRVRAHQSSALDGLIPKSMGGFA